MRIRTRSLVIMVGNGLTQATAILLGIVLVRQTDPETLGTYFQVFLAYAVVMGLLTLQLEQSLYYFLPKLGESRRRALVSQTALVTWAFAAMVAAVLFFGAPLIAQVMNNPALAPLLRVAALYPFAERLFAVIPAFLVSLDRAIRATVYGLAFSLTRIGITVCLFHLGYSLDSVIWAGLTVAAVVTAVGCLDMLRLSPGRWKLDWPLVGQQLYYAWPIWITGLVGTVNIYFDKLVISGFFDPATYAIYSRGAMEAPLVGLITASVATAIMPNMVVLADGGDRLGALALWQEGARKCSLIVLPCFALLMVVGPDLMLLMYGPRYAMAAWPFAIYLLMLPVRVAVYSSIFRALGQTGPLATSAVLGTVANVVLSTGLTWAGRGTLLAFIGPSLGAVGSLLVMTAYQLWRLASLIGVPVRRVMRWRELGELLLLAIACGLATILVPMPLKLLPVRLAIRSTLFCLLLLAGLISMRMLKPDEKRMLLAPARLLRRHPDTKEPHETVDDDRL